MPKVAAPNSYRLVKSVHPARPDWTFHEIDPGKAAVAELAKFPFFPKTCSKACTKTISLLPKISIAGHTGIGFPMVNIDGFRMLNAFVISDPLNSTLQRGFSLSISFAVNPFILGVGVIGETSFFFNFDTYFEPGKFTHALQHCQSSDLTTTGGLPFIGGNSLAHIVRVPVMGPFVRASVFNEDTVTRSAEVKAYLST